MAAAKAQAGDFPGALVLLHDAELNYVQAEKLSSDSHEFAMIQLKNQGQVKLLIAAALFRTGKASEAVMTVETAISQFTHVQSDETINVGIRDDAGRLLKEAQTILSRLKSTQ